MLDLSNLSFMLLIPALLFRTMASVHVEQLDLRPIAAYFPAALLWFGLQIVWFGFTTHGVVKALGGTFANMVMIGITLVDLAYGKQGLVTLLTLVSVHALTLLTVATVVLELAVAREGGADAASHGGKALLATVGRALRGAVLHPIPLPIMAGLLFAQTGWALPEVVDRPLALLGQAFGPISLVLVGVTLARSPLADHWRDALVVSVCKNVGLPAMVVASAWLMGIRGLPLTVMVVAAALPMGANVFMFSQRYKVAQDLVTAGIGLSTLLALVTLTVAMLVAGAVAG